ncbi:MAG TPA: cbb3-type cytochrome c oxidase subunit I, partial [Dehalococcoidia bacterium]|nr:cbb3-type cytochrome c oxidase subunit I [Dehalococcoidia bacterium]
MATAVGRHRSGLAEALRAAREAAADGRGIWSWLATVDHKRIGILYGFTALFFFVLGGIEALLIRVQLARPESTILNADQYNRIFTMHGTT